MKKHLEFLTTIFSSVVFITIGIFFIVNNTTGFKITFTYIGYAILISTIIKIINIFIKHKYDRESLTDVVINLVLGLLLSYFPQIFILLSSYIFGLYALAQSMSCFINFYIHKIDAIKGYILNFIVAIITLVFAILLMFGPLKNSSYFCIVAGIYLIFYGITHILELSPIKHKILIPMPIIFTMFLPKILIRKITKEMDTTKTNINKPDLEIMMHLAPSGSAGMGHIEISFEDKIYSYACYNYNSRRLWGGIGDGIVGIFDHNAYIKYCVKEQQRFIISYGMKLNDEEKKKIRFAINNFVNTNTELWYPDIQLYENKLMKKKDFFHMTDKLYEHCDGLFYRFTKGKYKTFFVLRTNCVTGTDSILKVLGIELLPIEGIITPGTYYKYIEELYQRKNSKIITKTIYTKEEVHKLKYKYINHNSHREIKKK